LYYGIAIVIVILRFGSEKWKILFLYIYVEVICNPASLSLSIWKIITIWLTWREREMKLRVVDSELISYK